MDKFHLILQKFIVLSFVFSFAFVSVYVPQQYNQAKPAEAFVGAAIDVLQLVQQQFINVATTAGAVASKAIAWATGNQWIKENVLDGLAWVLAKQIISQMTASIVNWINSGFEGSPAFVQDLGGFLTQAADETVGTYLDELGGPFSVLCSPFQLDIQLALINSYALARDGQQVSCTLTGALANLDNFMDGNFSSGGWDAWFQVTSQPEVYTPYGSYLAVEAELGDRILARQSEETKLLDFGSGFLSSRVCNTVNVGGVPTEQCEISTPGNVISEALTFQLSTGPRSLIEADEINEIISALFGQLTKQAITGTAGLLGLSSGGGSGVSNLGNSSVPSHSSNLIAQTLNEGLAAETSYRTAAEAAQSNLTSFGNSPIPPSTPEENELFEFNKRQQALAAAQEIPALLTTINSNIFAINTLLTRFNNSGESLSSEEAQQILQEYNSLGIHSEFEVEAAISNWNTIVN